MYIFTKYNRKDDFMSKIDIREHIRNNFKNADMNDIENSINSSIKSNDEIILPGLGVFFEVLWNNCTEKNKEDILNILMNHL